MDVRIADAVINIRTYVNSSFISIVLTYSWSGSCYLQVVKVRELSIRLDNNRLDKRADST